MAYYNAFSKRNRAANDKKAGEFKMGERRKEEILEYSDFLRESKGRFGTVAGISLDFCGFEHCLPRHSYGPNVRNNYVIHAVISGKGILDYCGKRWEIREGQIFILFPGEETTYYADRNDPWYYCWIGFQGESAAKIVESIGFSAQTPVLTLRDVIKVESGIRKMLEARNLTLDGQLKRNAGMLEILSDMILEHTESAETDSSPNIYSYSEYAVRYINNHFSEKIRIQDLADHIGISRSYLVKLMKQETGMSPQEYLIETRMRRASDLLSRTNDPVRVVAAECGYDDALAFSKVFKSRFGLNPTDYRETYNKNSRNDK